MARVNHTHTDMRHAVTKRTTSGALASEHKWNTSHEWNTRGAQTEQKWKTSPKRERKWTTGGTQMEARTINSVIGRQRKLHVKHGLLKKVAAVNDTSSGQHETLATLLAKCPARYWCQHFRTLFLPSSAAFRSVPNFLQSIACVATNRCMKNDTVTQL